MAFSVQFNSKNAISPVKNSDLNFDFDFSMRPPHPNGTKKYKMYVEFVSYYTTANGTLGNLSQLMLGMVGIGSIETFIARKKLAPSFNIPDGVLTCHLKIERGNYVQNAIYPNFIQKWMNSSYEIPVIIDILYDVGIFSVHLYNISNNQLNGNNANGFGLLGVGYIMTLHFEPI